MKPIIFNTETVRAIIDGQKTQTRRVVKLRNSDIQQADRVRIDSIGRFCFYLPGAEAPLWRVRPEYQVDDTLWVRETWKHIGIPGMEYAYYEAEEYYRNEDCIHALGDKDWQSSIHMPREAARIFLKVTGVRVERLRDISEADAVAEGAVYEEDLKRHVVHPLTAYQRFWNTFYAKKGYGWDTNPWVWVYEFERVERDD